MKNNKPRFYLAIIFFITLFSVQTTFSQTKNSNGYSFQIKIEKRAEGRRTVPKRDSVYINFDYGYKDDIIKIKTDDKTIVSDTLNADNLFGFGGQLRIAKSDLRKPIKIYFNDIFLKKMKVKNRFSSVHLEFGREEKSFIWRYMRYNFVYL